MALENGMKIVDSALSLAVGDLVQKGLPKDEAYIALLIRLKHMVPSEIQKVADLLSEDDEVNECINPDFIPGEPLSAHGK